MKLINRLIDLLANQINERIRILQLRDYYDNNCQCKSIAETEPKINIHGLEDLQSSTISHLTEQLSKTGTVLDGVMNTVCLYCYGKLDSDDAHAR